MKKLQLLLLLAVSVGACKKPGDQPVPTPVQRDLISSSRFYYIDGSYYDQFFHYDASGRLIKNDDRMPDGTLMSYREYFYTNGRLTDVTLHSPSAKVAQYHYSYSSGKAVKMIYQEYKNGTIQSLFEQLYEYAGDRLKKMTVNNLDGANSYYVVQEWAGNNVKLQKTYALPSHELTEETTYEYDSKPNPFLNVGNPAVGNSRFTSANNITRISTTRFQSGSRDEIQIEFEYDEQNRPVKQYNRFSDGRKMHEQTFNY